MKNISYIRLKQDLLPLFVAIIVTLIYCLFSATIYYMVCHGSDEFANEMEANGLYLKTALVTTCVVWVIAGIYYLLIDRWPAIAAWLLFYVGTLVATPFVTYGVLQNSFAELGFNFTANVENLAIINIGVAFLLFLFVSIGMKSLSKNCATTPF